MRLQHIGFLIIVSVCYPLMAQSPSVIEAPGAVFASRVEHLLETTTETSYQHKTMINETAGAVHCDCSGLIGYVLRNEIPEAYISLRGVEAPWRMRPLAVTYYETFQAARQNSNCGMWSEITKLMDVVPGDIIAWRKPNIEQGSTTGHVLMVAGYPEVRKDRLIRVRIIDSTRNSKRQGIGEDFKVFAINSHGEPISYSVGQQQRKAEIAIGRMRAVKQLPKDCRDEAYVGLDLEASMALAEKRKLTARVIRQDGMPKAVSFEIQLNRLNFVVRGGRVIHVLRG